ncbi:hypothetical protein [Variovorax gossypii]
MPQPFPPPTIGAVFREELGQLAWAGGLDFDRLIAADHLITERPDGRHLFADALWDICFPRLAGGVFGHHTDLTAFSKIIGSREIWLHAVAKHIRWGELELFAQRFDLDGYLARDANGERMLDELAQDMFSLSLTLAQPNKELWGRRFGPIRLNLEVVPIQERSELRRVAYDVANMQADHPFAVLREVSMRRLGRPLVPPRVNRAGAFFLPSKYQGQQEVRLLVKRLPGSPAINTKTASTDEVLPIPLGLRHPRVEIRLVSVQVSKPELVGPVENFLTQVADWKVAVSVADDSPTSG